MLTETLANVITVTLITAVLYIWYIIALRFVGEILTYKDMLKDAYFSANLRVWGRDTKKRKAIMRNMERKNMKAMFVKEIEDSHIIRNEKKDLNV